MASGTYVSDPKADDLISHAHSHTGILVCDDGQAITWLEVGEPSGTPLIHFHGTGSSRLEVLTAARLAAHAGVRLVSFDRPGFGGSPYVPGCKMDIVAGYVIDLVAVLGLKQFALSGFSGGFPYALTTAALAGVRCTSVIAINTAGDVADPAWKAVPISTRLLISVLTRRYIARRLWPRMFHDVGNLLTLDQTPLMRKMMVEAFRVGQSQGVSPVLDELSLFYQKGWNNPWPAVRAPIHFLHGAKDELLPFAQTLAETKLGARLIEIPGTHMDWCTPTVWNRILLSNQ